MGSKAALERRLAAVEGFDRPRADLEQYPTPADLAAHLVHLADLRGDLEGTVVDLGTGTGILALGAALREPRRVLGIDRDPAAIAAARDNEGRVDPPVAVEWLLGDVGRAPLRLEGATVLSNPPFGAQDANVHADRAFLGAAARIAAVSYSFHNAGSREFVASFAADNGGTVTDAFAVEFALDRQFDFQAADRATIDAEAFRIEWGGYSPR